MEKNSMYFDTHRAKINKDIYRPSSNIFRLLKSLWAVMMIGRSPISHSSYSRKHFH